MEDHTDDNGLWIKSPKITAKQIKQRISKAELENRQMITITTVIERFCKAGFPKMKREGSLCGKEIMNASLHLIGKNKRTAHMEHDDDEYGNGHITFKACKQFNTKKPESWDDLFEKFPSGHGILTEKNGKKLIGVSMYDHPVFSKYLIEELTPGLINSYLDEHSPSWGTKRKMIYAIQCVWHNSKKYMGPNKPLDPTTKEALEVKSCGVSKSKNSKYNKKKNSQYNMEVMWAAFQQINHEKKHPFQAECYMLEMASGRHHSELSKLKKADVFIFPSHLEGFPNVVLEALNYRLPIITTNVGGTSESVINDFNGYLIESKNKKQLLEAIILISSDEEKRINFSNNTLSVLLNNHQIEVSCKKLLDIFKIKTTTV